MDGSGIGGYIRNGLGMNGWIGDGSGMATLGMGILGMGTPFVLIGNHYTFLNIPRVMLIQNNYDHREGAY